MKLAGLILKRKSYSEFIDERNWCWCASGLLGRLQQILDVPRDCTALWIELHNRPSQYRAELQVRLDLNQFPFLESNERFFGYGIDLEEILKPFIGRTVYIQVEYECD